MNAPTIHGRMKTATSPRIAKASSDTSKMGLYQAYQELTDMEDDVGNLDLARQIAHLDETYKMHVTLSPLILL